MAVIAWEEAGAGRPVVLVHGITEDRRSWDAVWPMLAETFRCIRLDLRGHGKSGDADDYSALAMAADVGAVVDEAGLDEPPLLIGHSLGAVVVTAYAASGGANVGVVNVDQSLRFGDFATALQPFADALRGPECAETVAAIIDTLGTARLRPEDLAYVTGHKQALRQDVVLGVWSMVLDADPAELTATAEQLLGAVRTPYLALHGSDPGPDYEAWLTAAMPDATVEVWDGDGHYLHMVDPVRFVTRVRDFAATL
jgi:pimeloyl-ACP methyl ester carboxylesterase